jgi:uncharacterized membrane protein
MTQGDFKQAYDAGRESVRLRFSGLTFAISFAIAFIVSDVVSHLYELSFLYRTLLTTAAFFPTAALVSFVKRRLDDSTSDSDQE